MNADQIHHRSGGMTLVCSSCNTQNSIPLMHPNWLTKESTSTYCQSCERVTLQRNPRFKGSNASGILLKHSDSDRASKALSGRSRATSNNPSFTNPLVDVVNQSVYLSNTSIPQGIQINVPGAPIMEASDKSSAQITKLNAPEPHCTVHPNQVGEYWCCLDRVIVCPRCHVHGIHKDHPFINLVDAAQRHTAGLLSWCTRAREQLQQTSKVKATLLYASEMVQKAKEEQNAAIHETFERLHQELNERRTQLLQELESQTSTKLDSFDRAIEDICKLIDHHEENLLQVEPLIQYTPLVQHDSDLESDKDTFHWATKIMAVVQRIQFSVTDPIPLPNVSVPLILCSLSDISFLQGIRLETVPTGLRLPEYVDTNSFNFSFSGGVPSRTIFRFKPPSSSDPSLLLLNEGMTLSREPSPSHFHKLILGSQVFYNGVVAWYVHIDRIGPGLGHILCGIMEYGSEGEGVVWDGIRIVGPNAHEERTIVDGGTWKAGDVLGFLLELDTNTPHLTCSYNYDHIVSRVLLPTRNSGWCPAFSIHCSLDQITIIPAGERSHLSVKKLDNNSCNREVSKQTENKALIRSLQEQLASISQRFMMEQQKQMERDELLTHMTMSMARNPVRNFDENEANKYTAGNMKHVEIPAPKTSPLKSAVRPAFRKESENNEMHDKKSSTVPVHSKNDQIHSKSKNEGIEFGNEINSENIVSDELKMLMDFVSNLDK